jgi:hypothetical protein
MESIKAEREEIKNQRKDRAKRDRHISKFMELLNEHIFLCISSRTRLENNVMKYLEYIKQSDTLIDIETTMQLRNLIDLDSVPHLIRNKREKFLKFLKDF